jgi:subtilisin family serine protease
MKKRSVILAGALAIGFAIGPAGVSEAAIPPQQEISICQNLFGGVFGSPNSEPFAPCQWDMAIMNAGTASYARATGQGVKVGVIDSGVQTNHPDIAPNLNLALSCSFLTPGTPTAAPGEIPGPAGCANKAAVEDLAGHGTHVASTIAAPVNGVGIAGVAPRATIVALKACTMAGFCFVDAVSAALRYAGDQRLDVVNLSLFADPFLFYCKSDAEQRAMLQQLESAARYAQQRGVVIVASAGNETADLQHPLIDDVSPDWPPGAAVTREVRNNCRVAPAELPEALTVSATGPVGYPGYNLIIADYSSVGMSRVDVTAPGGDYFRASGTVQDAVLAALPIGSDIWNGFDPLNANFPGITTTVTTGAGTFGYGYLNGTSMSSPHAAGVAALVSQLHPNWNPGAVKSAVERTTQAMSCPPDWQPLSPTDQRERCYGNGGRTSFFGKGMVDALAASQA